MELGIFSRTFSGPTLSNVLDAIRSEDIPLVHFNLASAGVDSMPAEISESLVAYVRAAFDQANLRMVGISGTFNAIHPDIEQRREATRRCIRLIESAPALGTRLVSLCTGSQDRENMWKAHPENASPESWKALRSTLQELLAQAEQSGVFLGIEPELANVIDSAPKARRILDEMRSPNLKIILDAANLIRPEETGKIDSVLREALDLLAGEIVMVHAKDLAPEGEPHRQAAGTGLLDFDLYFNLLHGYFFDGPVVLHNLRPDQVAASASFVKARMERIP